jgi:polysaccharide pyruvyl transferase WcaK-like protein
MKNIIFYQAKTQFENTGDLLINKSLIDLLRTYGRLVVNDKGVPPKFSEQLGLKDEERLTMVTKSAFSVYLLMVLCESFFKRNMRVYLFSGFGHLYGGSFKQGLKLVLGGFVFMFLKLMRCQIVKVGFSLGPIGFFVGKAEAFRAQFVSRYFVRDTLSLDLARETGIRHVEVFPDLAWSFRPQFFVKRLRQSGQRPTVFISFRESTHELDVTKGYKFFLIRTMKILLDEIRPAKIKIGYQVERDKKFCLQIFSDLVPQYKPDFVDERVTVVCAGAVYGDVDYVLSNRLHVLLFAYKFGALPLAVIDKKKHLKITGIFRDSDLSDLLFDLNDDEGSARLHMRNIVDMRAVLGERLERQENLLAAKSAEILCDIFGEK